MDAIQDSFRTSLGRWVIGTAAGIGTALLGLAGIVLLIGMGGDWGAWPLVLTGLSLAIIFVKWLEVMSALYQVTPERLIIRRGIVMKSIDEVELYRVKDVRLNYSLLNQMTGIGALCLTTSDETTRAGDLVIRNVPKAQARREELRRLVDAARRKRGVREIDMVHEDI